MGTTSSSGGGGETHREIFCEQPLSPPSRMMAALALGGKRPATEGGDELRARKKQKKKEQRAKAKKEKKAKTRAARHADDADLNVSQAAFMAFYRSIVENSAPIASAEEMARVRAAIVNLSATEITDPFDPDYSFQKRFLAAANGRALLVDAMSVASVGVLPDENEDFVAQQRSLGVGAEVSSVAGNLTPAQRVAAAEVTGGIARFDEADRNNIAFRMGDLKTHREDRDRVFFDTLLADSGDTVTIGKKKRILSHFRFSNFYGATNTTIPEVLYIGQKILALDKDLLDFVLGLLTYLPRSQWGETVKSMQTKTRYATWRWLFDAGRFSTLRRPGPKPRLNKAAHGLALGNWFAARESSPGVLHYPYARLFALALWAKFMGGGGGEMQALLRSTGDRFLYESGRATLGAPATWVLFRMKKEGYTGIVRGANMLGFLLMWLRRVELE
jgi:hypothetical protein